MMSNNQTLISDFAAYFTVLEQLFLMNKTQWQRLCFISSLLEIIVKKALLKTLRENVEELLSIISSAKCFFIEVAR